MATRIRYDIDISGPFFTKDVRKTVRENMRAALLETVMQGRDIVQQQLTPGHGYLTGNLSNHIQASNKSLTGQPWALSAVVRSTVNQTMPGHKGYAMKVEAKYGMFRNARSAMRRAGKLLKANYTRGLE